MKCYKNRNIILILGSLAILLITVNNLSNMHSKGVDLIGDNIEDLNDDFKKLNQGGIFSEFIFGTSYGPQDLDPHMAWDSDSIDVIDQVCEGLLKHDLSDPELSIIPNLASSLGTWSVDKKNYTISLRTGIQFHDGTVFNATAVKWSFDRLIYFMNVSGTLPPTKFITPFALLYRFYDNTPIINRIEIINEYIVRFVLNKPFAPLEGLLCFTGSYILSPHSTPEFEYIDTNTGDLVGTGPFVYDGYVVDTSVNFYAFEDYWRGKPNIQNLVFSIISNYNDRSQALLSGDIDLLMGPSYDYFDAFESDPNIVLVGGKNVVTFSLNMNNNHINKKMRQAISYAINYSHIIEAIMQNRVVRLKSPIPEGILYANWSFNVATYNVTNARELMQSMGFGLGWDTTYPGTNEAEWSATTFATFNFTYYEGSTTHEDLSILVQDNLDKIGIEVTDAGMNWSEYVYRLYGYGTYNRNMLDLFWIGWGPEYNDPCKIIDNLFSNRSIDNWVQVNDPYLENLIDNGINEINPIVREQIYDEIQRYLVEDLMPYAFGYVARKFDAYRTYVMGFQSNPMGKLWLYSVSRDISVPTVETIDAINILKSEALLIGSISEDGGSDILEMRFEWGITPSCTDNWTHEVDTTNNVFTFHLNGLTPDTTYYFRASARNEKGWSYGSVLNFITLNSSDYEWYRTWGGGSDYYGNVITFDSLNNLYVAGWTFNYLSYDRDIFIAKFNSLGTEEWRYTFDLGGYEQFSDIAIDYLNNVFITGTQYTSDSTGDDLFLIKVNSDGLMQWNITWGGNDHDYCDSLAIDTSNNIYLGGYTFSFGAQNRDMLLVKFDNMGNLQWYETWGFTYGDYCTDIIIDSSDNIYLTGYSHSFGDADMCLVKYNNQGVEQWYRTWDGGQGAIGNAIAVDSTDNLYITGYIYNLITYEEDIILVKYNDNGILQWSRTWGGNKVDEGIALALDSLNNVYITGYSESFGNGQACLLKYNSIGILQWDRLWGFSGSDYAGTVAINSSDFIHLLVSSSGFVPMGYDIFLVKYNSLGVEVSKTTINSVNEAYGTNLATDSLNNIYVAGALDSSLTLSFDMFVVKYDSSGNELWNQTWGGNGLDGALAIEIDSLNNIYLAGYTDSSGAGNGDMCLVKFNSLGEEQWNITWGESNHDMGCGLALDSLGNIYLAGIVNVSGNNYYELCLVKYNNIGVQQWNRTWGKVQNIQPYINLELDSLDNIYIVGLTNTSGTEDYDVCLVKYDSTGEQKWFYTWGGSGYEYGFGIALDSSDNIYITGQTSSFGIDYDMFLVKYNNLGAEQWNRIWDSGDSDYGSGIAIDTYDNIYIGGYKYTGGFGYSDVFLVKYNYLGTELWNKTWGGDFAEICYGITLDSSSNIYLTGFTNSFMMDGYESLLLKFSFEPVIDLIEPDSVINSGPIGTIDFNDIEFSWTGLDDNSPPSMLVYSYILEGFDSEWSEWTSNTSKAYNNLHNGDYIFKIRARDMADNIQSIPTQRSFTVYIESGIPSLDQFLMETDPLTRNICKTTIAYIVANNGNSIWDTLTTKYSAEFKFDFSTINEVLLNGFAPKLKIKLEAWKEDNEIHIKCIPELKIDLDNDIFPFFGPLKDLEKIMSSVSKYPGVDLDIDFGFGGFCEIVWNLDTNILFFEEYDYNIWLEIKLIGQYIPLLISLFNPPVAKFLADANNFIEKYTDFSFFDMLIGEVTLKFICSVGLDSDGKYAKFEVRPEANALVVDIESNDDPEIVTGIKGAFSLKWNSEGIGFAGEVKLAIEIDFDIGVITFGLKEEITLLSVDTILWDFENSGAGGYMVSSLYKLSGNEGLDTDLDGLSDYLENIWGTSINDPDTDDDEISDYFEVFYGTNPLNSDTDNDGLSDYDEVIFYYSNPLKEDTDNDKLTDFEEVYGIFGGIVTNPILNDTDFDGLLDGDEPTGINPANPGTNATDYDTDKDGYSDGDEVNKYFTNPLNNADIPVDTDSDGVPDIDEIEMGTNPNIDEYSLDTDSDTIPDIIEELVFKTNKNLLDSDFDGYNDNIEIKNGTNPNNPLHYPGTDYIYPDTDGEGLPDIIENYLYFTNYLLVDTDGDSYDDLEEILGGSNPNNASDIPGFNYRNNFDDIDLENGEEIDDTEILGINGYGIIMIISVIIATISIIIIFKEKNLKISNQ